MHKQQKDILASVIRGLRHELLGYAAKDGTAVRGDLDRVLERLGVRPDGHVLPIDALPNATRAEQHAHESAERFLAEQQRQGRTPAAAREEYIEQAAYSWINRLVALRALEARSLIAGTLRPDVAYGEITRNGGVSEALYVLAQTDPASVAGEDRGWWAVIEVACAEQAEALPGLFGAGDPVLTLRPSVPALRRCVALLGVGPQKAGVEATDAAFADPDAIGWAYQFYQEEAKARAFASFGQGKKADTRATIAAATQLFTEPYMVKWLLQNSLGRSFHALHSASALPETWEYYIREQGTGDRGQGSGTGSLEDLTVLDPCVGSGHFLREAFDMLAAMYREQHPGMDAAAIADTVLRRHLHGIDIDPRAVQLAALTLYMRALDLIRDEARARRRPVPRWVPQALNLATTPTGLDAGALERHLDRHPEDRPLREVLRRVFESLARAEILGSLLRPSAEIDAEIARIQSPRQSSLFDTQAGADAASLADRDPHELKREILDRIARAFRAEALSPDPADALFGREAERGVRLLQLLDRRYAVVVTNPPYMGSKNMPDPLKKYVEQHYKPGKRDLYAAFILRCLDLCVQGGRVAMVTQQSWMFLRSFADLRAVPEERLADARKKHEFAGLLRETNFEALAHLGPNAFEEISGAVVQTVLVVFQKRTSKKLHHEQRLVALRATGAKNALEKEHLLRKHNESVVFIVRQDAITNIERAPIVYDLPELLMDVVINSRKFEEIGYVRQGVATTNNDRFLRSVAEITETMNRWYIYHKGGGFGRWRGFETQYINWENDGALVKTNIDSRPDQFVWQMRMPQSDIFLIPGMVYSLVCSGSLSVRKVSNSIFDVASPFIKVEISDINLVSSLLNCRIVSYLLRKIIQDLKFHAGYLFQLPLPYELNNARAISNSIVPICVNLKEEELSYNLLEVICEPSSFNKRRGDFSIEQILLKYTSLRHTLESVLERAIFDIYGMKVDAQTLQTVLDELGTPVGFYPLVAGYDVLPELPAELELPALPAEVVAYLAAHERIVPTAAKLAQIKARLRALYEQGPGAREQGPGDEAQTEDGEAEAGDEEAAVSGARIPIPTETFLEELSVKMELHPISVYWLLEELRAEGARCRPEERRLLEDRLSVLTLRLLGHRWPKQIEAGEPLPEWADRDGIIPLGEVAPGEATMAERLRAWLRAEDGDIGAQRTEALLVELTGAQSLEDWLARTFWPRHVRQFKARPVAWHLTSRPAGAKGKGKSGRRAPLFECMLYYHATGGDALARLRTQYVEPLLRREEALLTHARDVGDLETAARVNERVEELNDFLHRIEHVEREGFACAELDALLVGEPLDRWSGDGIVAPPDATGLLRQERAWRVDLNDGVRVNIAPLQQAGLLAADVLKAADAKKAIADRARWRADERRWVREGKLPRCGWMGESVPESPEWTRKAPERAAEQRKLEAKRRAVVERGEA